jgi:hypothetical protein
MEGMGPAPRCPKCTGRLVVEPDLDGLTRALAPELACLSCGWRATTTLAALGFSPPGGEARGMPRLPRRGYERIPSDGQRV